MPPVEEQRHWDDSMNMAVNSAHLQDGSKMDMDNILKFFSEGITRFLSIIDGNPGYDTILSHHLSDRMKADFSDDLPIAARQDRAIALARNSLQKMPQTWLMPSFRNFSCYGSTRNNIREFEFFDAICAPLNISIINANYKLAEMQPAWELTPEQIKAREEIEAKIEVFYRHRDQISPGLVRQFNIYFKNFYLFLVSFTSHGAVWPKCVVFANDHSPATVAVSMVIKGLGIPRIYFQHAEVSSVFPPLDFEYSVLRNERSLKTYSAISELQGRTYVIPRLSDLPGIEALETPLPEPVKVVIYPTASILGPEMPSLVGRLLDNPLVREVAVKDHPNASVKVADWVHDERLQFLKAIPSDPHVAIVGNSSIAVELISKAIPVYQNFDFDPVSRDYYGFVRAGLVPEVTAEGLAGRFWEPYVLDQAWCRTLSEWVPAAAEDDADRNAFLQAMGELARSVPAVRHVVFDTKVAKAAALQQRQARRRLRSSAAVAHLSTALARVSPGLHAQLRPVWHRLRGIRPQEAVAVPKPKPPATVKRKEPKDSRPPEEQVEQVASILSGSSDPLAWLDQNEETKAFGPLVVIAAVERLVQKRDVSVSDILRDNPGTDLASMTFAWLELKRSERSNVPMTSERIGQLTDQIAANAHSPRLKSMMERALLPALINHGTAEQLIGFLEAHSNRWQRAALPTKVAILKRLTNVPSQQARAEDLRAQMLATADAFDRLKIANAECFAGNPSPGWNHAHAEQMFLTSAPMPVRTQYVTEIMPVFEKLRPRMSLMDVRTDVEQKSAFLSQVRTALTDFRGFSCIRLSDGEGYLFPDAGHFHHKDSLNRERHWWGIELSDAQRTAIRLEANEALRNADVIGLPSVFRFIRDTSVKTQSLTASVQGRGLVSCLHSIDTLALSDAVAFSEDKFNVALFANIDVVLDLAASARKVVVVSSIRPEHLPQGLRGLPNIDHVSLPTHNNTKNTDAYVQSDLPFPLLYPKLLEEFERKVQPGTLAIVAGGIIGKIFIGAAKKHGAVALDIGHVIDDWVTPKLTTLR